MRKDENEVWKASLEVSNAMNEEERLKFNIVHAQILLFAVVALVWPWAEGIFSSYLKLAGS